MSLRGACGRRGRVGPASRHRPRGGRPTADLPAPRRRPEHVLHARLRAVRARRARRQPPPLRVPVPEPRNDLADRPHARHAPRDAGLPRSVARRPGRTPPAGVHGRVRRRRRAGPLACDRPGRAAGPAGLRPRAGVTRPVPPDGLAVPRNARGDRARPRLLRRGGGLLPRNRAQHSARLPGQGKRRANRALLRARARGRRQPERGAGRAAALASTGSSSPARRRATA